MNKNFSMTAALALSIILIAGVLLIGASARAEIRTALTTSTIKVFHDTPIDAYDKAYEIHAVRNEYAPFQLALESDEAVSGVSVSISDFVNGGNVVKVSEASLLFVENVTIERPTIGTEVTDQMVWPDPLPPLKPFDLKPGETRAVWFDLFVPKDAAPGKYAATISVTTAGGGAISVPVTLLVAGVTLHDDRTLSTAFGISYSQILTAHKISAEDPGAQKLKEDYYWFMIDHRLSPYYIPVDLFSDEAALYMNDPRVTFLRAPFTHDRPEMERIAARLKEQGWMNKAVFYMIDEPEPKEFPQIVKNGQYLHSIDPGLRFLMTHGYSPGMEGAGIQIWCPVLMNTVDATEMANIEKEKKRGKEFWWYTCIGPKWHGMNYFTDEAATAPRLHPWMNYLYDVTGILYWQVTNWSRVQYNPWETTETYPSGNGDGQLLFPGEYVGYNGPVASIRLKMLREGMEDYELLKMLRGELEEAAATLGADKYDPSDRIFEHAFNLIREDGRSNLLGSRTPYLMFVTTDYKEVEKRRDLVVSELASTMESPLLLVTTNPRDGAFTNEDAVMVRGWMNEGAEVTVNGKPVKIKGNRFMASVPLVRGENVIKVSATLDGDSKTVQRIINKR